MSAPSASAQVILRPASGREIRGDTPIVAENIAEYLPAEAKAREAQEAFRAAGFEVGPVVGISFSITAPAARFEDHFGVELGGVEEGAPRASGQRPREELPLDRLPERLRNLVSAVTFTPPADLHEVDLRHP